RGKARGSAQEAYAIAERRGAKRLDYLRTYLESLYHFADQLGINADILVAQADLETGNRQTGVGFQDWRWTDEGNPAGIGIVDGKKDGGHIFVATEAAQVHVTHMACYLGITPPQSWIDLDFRWQAATDAGFFGAVTNVEDLGNGKWASDPKYASKILERYRIYWGEPEQDVVDRIVEIIKETSMAGYKKYNLPGLAEPAYLPDWLQVDIRIIPSSVAGWTSGQRLTGQSKIT